MHDTITRSPALKCGDRSADLVDYADAFVAENAAGGASRHIPFEDMQVGPADCRLDDFDDGVGRRLDLRFRPIFERLLFRSMIDESLHNFLILRGFKVQLSRSNPHPAVDLQNPAVAPAPPASPGRSPLRILGHHPPRDKEHHLASPKCRRESTPQTRL